MRMSDIKDLVIKTGICDYETKQYRVFISRNDIYPGSGDYEDEAEICNDREHECFVVCFESIMDVGILGAGGGYFEQLEDAIQMVERSAGFQAWIDGHGCELQLNGDGNYHYYYGNKDNFAVWVAINRTADGTWYYKRMGGSSRSNDFDSLQTCIDHAHQDMVRAKM